MHEKSLARRGRVHLRIRGDKESVRGLAKGGSHFPAFLIEMPTHP